MEVRDICRAAVAQYNDDAEEWRILRVTHVMSSSLEELRAFRVPQLPGLPEGATGWLENDGSGGYRVVNHGPGAM